MNSVKILHCADIHIGAAESFLGVTAASRRYETLLTFERIIDTAKENDIKIIAIAGDLFDNNGVDEAFVAPVFEKIASVPNIKVIFAAGNHDPLTSDSPFKRENLPQNLYVLDTNDDSIALEELKVRIYGKSFDSVYMQGKECFSIKPQDDEYINIMVIHGELTSGLSSDYNSITPNFVKTSKMDYIALGHVHKRSEVLKLGNTYFAYSGCPEGQGFDETEVKGVYIGEVSKGKCDLKFIPVSKRLHVHEKIDISGKNEALEIASFILENLKEKYGENFEANLYKIELLGEVQEDYRPNVTEITSRLSERLYYVKLKDSTELKIDFEAISQEISLKGLFVKNMLKKIEASNDEDVLQLKKALKIGLAAFGTEVAYNED